MQFKFIIKLLQFSSTTRGKQKIAFVICLFDKNKNKKKKLFQHKKKKKVFEKDVKQEEERNEIWRKAGRGSACKAKEKLAFKRLFKSRRK